MKDQVTCFRRYFMLLMIFVESSVGIPQPNTKFVTYLRGLIFAMHKVPNQNIFSIYIKTKFSAMILCTMCTMKREQPIEIGGIDFIIVED